MVSSHQFIFFLKWIEQRATDQKTKDGSPKYHHNFHNFKAASGRNQKIDWPRKTFGWGKKTRCFASANQTKGGLDLWWSTTLVQNLQGRKICWFCQELCPTRRRWDGEVVKRWLHSNCRARRKWNFDLQWMASKSDRYILSSTLCGFLFLSPIFLFCMNLFCWSNFQFLCCEHTYCCCFSIFAPSLLFTLLLF